MTVNKNYLLTTAGILLSFLLLGCGAEDGDITPPNITLLKGIPATTSSTGPFTLTGSNDADATVTAEIFSPTGFLLAELDDTDPAPEAWRIDIADMLLEEGTNTIAIEAADSISNARILNIFITLDLTGPVVTISQYDSPTIPGLSTFAGSVNELGSTVSLELFDQSDPPISVLGPLAGIPTTLGNGVWSAQLDLSGLADGSYTLEANGFDRFDNASAAVASQSIVIDSSAPSLDIVSPMVLPHVISDPQNVSEVAFSGTRETGCELTVAKTSGVLSNPNLNDAWDFTLTGLVSGNTVVTLTVGGGTCAGTSTSRLLVVRDLTAPLVADFFPRSADSFVAPASPTMTVVFGEEMTASTVAANRTVLLENVTDTVNVVSVALTAAGNDGVAFDFAPTNPLTAGKYRVRVLNDTEEPDLLSIQDLRQNEFAGEASVSFVVE